MTIKSFLYDQFIAGRYDRTLAEVTDDFRRILFERMAIEPGATVLDLGCGTGLNQPHLAAAVGTEGRIIGVDASSQMLEQARARAEREDYADRLNLIQGDARQLDTLVRTSPDAVVATLIFSVVPAWRDVFRKSYDLLKPGGRYGVMDNYWPNPSLRLWFLSWTFAADAKRPGFEPLSRLAEDFQLEYHPPDSDVQFYVAYGTKPR
jgi:ubiquinone/menaquinone biosynthesis C-methylase UbiE